MTNGIKIFRERAGITKAELARRLGTNRQQVGRLETDKRKLSRKWADRIAPILGCPAEDLMFPELAKVDTSRFNNVFSIAESGANPAETPAIALESEFLNRMLPNIARHKLRYMMVEADQANNLVTKGDALVIDTDDNRPTRPALYAVEIAGIVQWRFLSPTTDGHVLIHADSAGGPHETVEPSKLKVIGRARLRISTL